MAKPLAKMVFGGNRGLDLSTGVELSSTSDSWLGVAAPLSLDIHSSSSSPSSEGLAIVKPALCLADAPLLLEDAECRRCVVGWAGSFCCNLTLLLLRDMWAPPRPFAYTQSHKCVILRSWEDVHTSKWWCAFFCLSASFAGAGSFWVNVRVFSPSLEPPPDDARECVRAIALPERCAPCA